MAHPVDQYGGADPDTTLVRLTREGTDLEFRGAHLAGVLFGVADAETMDPFRDQSLVSPVFLSKFLY